MRFIILQNVCLIIKYSKIVNLLTVLPKVPYLKTKLDAPQFLTIDSSGLKIKFSLNTVTFFTYFEST